MVRIFPFFSPTSAIEIYKGLAPEPRIFSERYVLWTLEETKECHKIIKHIKNEIETYKKREKSNTESGPITIELIEKILDGTYGTVDETKKRMP